MWIITPNDDAAKQAILDKMKDRMAEINNTIPPSFPIVFYGDNNNAQTVTWGEHGETRFTHIVDEMYKPVKKMIEKYKEQPYLADTNKLPVSVDFSKNFNATRKNIKDARDIYNDDMSNIQNLEKLKTATEKYYNDLVQYCSSHANEPECKKNGDKNPVKLAETLLADVKNREKILKMDDKTTEAEIKQLSEYEKTREARDEEFDKWVKPSAKSQEKREEADAKKRSDESRIKAEEARKAAEAAEEARKAAEAARNAAYKKQEADAKAAYKKQEAEFETTKAELKRDIGIAAEARKNAEEEEARIKAEQAAAEKPVKSQTQVKNTVMFQATPAGTPQASQLAVNSSQDSPAGAMINKNELRSVPKGTPVIVRRQNNGVTQKFRGDFIGVDEDTPNVFGISNTFEKHSNKYKNIDTHNVNLTLKGHPEITNHVSAFPTDNNVEIYLDDQTYTKPKGGSRRKNRKKKYKTTRKQK